jgi:hypothetical protein
MPKPRIVKGAGPRFGKNLPTPKIVDLPPAKTLSQALANAKKAVDAAR